jgi:DNA polymerase III delta subunit
MPSKNWLPWDFEKNHPNIILPEKKGIYGFHAFDPFIERIFLRKLSSKANSSHFEGGHIQTMMGSELTIEWAENTFQSMSFFGGSESYVILQSEEIPAKVKEFFLDESFKVEDRYLVFSFSKDNKFYSNLVKKQKDGTYLKISAPPFWKNRDLLLFISNQMKINLTYDLQEFILEAVPTTPSDFVHALNLLRLHMPSDREMNLESAKEVIGRSKFDFFALAPLFCKKNFTEFYKSILEAEVTTDVLQVFFGFLQGHLVKVLDPSYLAAKGSKKLSKYDREIQSVSKLWKKEELSSALRFFGELQIYAKKKDPILKEKIRLAYIESLK